MHIPRVKKKLPSSSLLLFTSAFQAVATTKVNTGGFAINGHTVKKMDFLGKNIPVRHSYSGG